MKTLWGFFFLVTHCSKSSLNRFLSCVYNLRTTENISFFTWFHTGKIKPPGKSKTKIIITLLDSTDNFFFFCENICSSFSKNLCFVFALSTIHDKRKTFYWGRTYCICSVLLTHMGIKPPEMFILCAFFSQMGKKIGSFWITRSLNLLLRASVFIPEPSPNPKPKCFLTSILYIF